MTFLRSFFTILAFSLLVFACKKEYSSEDGEKPGAVINEWEFSIGDVVTRGPMDSGYVQSVGSVTTLSTVGTKTEDPQGEIFLQVVGERIEVGSYTNPLVFFQYSEGGNVVYQSSPVQTGGFTINITSLDSTFAEGTFSGTVLDALGNQQTLTNGKFKTRIAGWESEPEPVQEGQLTVWARQICTAGSPIEIRIGGQTAQITDGLTTDPECGSTGGAVFTLQAGTYTLEAICDTDTLRYAVQIAEPCTILEVDFQNPPTEEDYLPLGNGSFWEYNDFNDAGTEQKITSDGSETFDGRMYTRFTSTTGEIFYYRKEQNVYFQYRTLNFEGYVTDPPSVELVILYDNLNEGESWESPGEDIDLSGIPVKIKLISRINRRDFQQTYNGVTYTDLIEVNTEIFFSSDGGNTYSTSGSAYNTVFAKDKGIVYYYDIDRDIEWTIKNISLVP